jgi:hypothetical protein
VTTSSAIVAAAVCTALVAAFTVLALGWGPEGAHLAARNTARIASVVFALALLGAPAWAFVAAQLVHYAAVASQVFVNPQAGEHLLSASGVIKSALGLLLALSVGLTNARLPRLHEIALAITTIAFLGALGFGVSRGHRIDIMFLLALAAAAALRLRRRIKS